MEFDNNSPIYLQIADYICENILSGVWTADERIPSVRELSIELQVNPNTTMRSYEHLQRKEIIYNKRGIGFFVAPDGCARIVSEHKQTFIETELPKIRRKMSLLGFSKEEIIGLLSQDNG